MEFSLSEQQCIEIDFDPRLDDHKIIERIITSGIWITMAEYAIKPERKDTTNETLKADPDTQLANNTVKITICDDGLVTFLKNYMDTYKVRPDLTIVLFGRRGQDNIECFTNARALKEYKDKLIYQCEHGAEDWKNIEERMKEIFNEYGVYYDSKDHILKRNTTNK